MSASRNSVRAQDNTTTRRQVIASVAIALGGVAAAAEVWGKPLQQAAKQAPSADANKMRTSIHEEADFKTSPPRIYEVLLDQKKFAACTGLPAEIDPNAGGAFSLFGGQITGRNVELVPNQRVVQAWRPGHWDPGVYSIVKFELKAQGADTTELILDHTGFPEGQYDGLDWGWHNHYLDTLKKYFA
jgi:activator of HSP90 ATPase